MRAFHCFLLLLIAIVTMAPRGAFALAITENFELGDGGFASTTLNSWAWGQPSTTSSAGAAKSGVRAWGTNLNGPYAGNLNTSLLSPVYDLSAAAGQYVVLHWWQHLQTEVGFDYAEVQVSKNGGGSWETVFGPQHGLVNTQWTQQTVLLDPSYATAGFRIRFILRTDVSVSVGGFFVDDIRISTLPFTTVVPTQTFEANDGGYLESGTNSTWEHGIPTSAPGSASSGTSVWATNLNGFYEAGESSTLTAPVMNLSSSAGSHLAVTWHQYFDTEQDSDFLLFEVSADGGGSWSTLASQTGEVSTAGWMRMHAFVPAEFATAGFRFRFRFECDESYQYDGVALDDVTVLASSGVEPVTGSFTKSAPENRAIQFRSNDFTTAYVDPDGDALEGIEILQLPAAGTLKLSGVPVTSLDQIPLAFLGNLTFDAPANTIGSWSFSYRARNFFAPSAPGTVTLEILGPTPQVVITEDPSSATVNPQTAFTFNVVAVSSLTLSYQWRKNGDDIPNANASTYTINSVQESDEATYDVRVSNTSGTEFSSVAELSVNDPVTITSEPGPTSVGEGSDASFNIIASGTGPFDYQWFKNGIPLNNENTAVLEFNDVEPEDEGSYHCVVSNIVGPKPSTSFPLSVVLAPRIISHPASLGLRTYSTARFSVAVEGTGPFTYQWYRDGFMVPGATAESLVLTDLRVTNMGNYTVKVSNGLATAESNPARLQVYLWRQVYGQYQDVLEREMPGAADSLYSGKVSVTLTRLSSFTGVLNYEGSRYSFSGRWKSGVYAERTFPRRGRSPLLLRLELDAIGETVTASVTHLETAGLVRSTAITRKHLYHRRTNPAPQAGRTTWALEPTPPVLTAAPDAPGYLTGSVSAGGFAVVAGRLPSGRSIVMSGLVHSIGRVALYSSHRHTNGAKAGHTAGRLVLGLGGNAPVLGGALHWKHVARNGATFLPTSFVLPLAAVGSPYLRPARLERVITLPLGAEMFDLVIDGPMAGGPIQRQLRLTDQNKFFIDPVTDTSIRLVLHPVTGRLSGSFIDTATGKRHSMHGVVLQAQQSMSGNFRIGDGLGSFTAVPLVQ